MAEDGWLEEKGVVKSITFTNYSGLRNQVKIHNYFDLFGLSLNFFLRIDLDPIAYITLLKYLHLDMTTMGENSDQIFSPSFQTQLAKRFISEGSEFTIESHPIILLFAHLAHTSVVQRVLMSKMYEECDKRHKNLNNYEILRRTLPRVCVRLCVNVSLSADHVVKFPFDIIHLQSNAWYLTDSKILQLAFFLERPFNIRSLP